MICKYTAHGVRNKPFGYYLYSFGLALFFLLDILMALFLNENTLTLRIIKYLGIIIAFLLFLYAIIVDKIQINKFEIVFFLVMLCSMAISISFNRNLSYKDLLSSIKYIFLFYVIYKTNFSSLPIAIVYIMLSLYFILNIFLGVSVIRITNGVSQNAISLFLLPYLCLYFICNHGKLRTLSASTMVVLYLVISIWTGSRSAVITALILVFAVIFLSDKLFSIKSLKKIILALLLFGSLLAMLKLTGHLDNFLSTILSREKRPIENEPRYFIINEYIASLKANKRYFWFGVPLGVTEWIKYYNNNPHSMFIMLHAHFGFVFFVFVIILMLYSLIIFLKKDKIYGFLFIALILRGATDSAGFPGVLDPFILYFIFYSFKLKKTRTKNAKTIKRNAKSLNVAIAETSK